jgi:hypothetical protein
MRIHAAGQPAKMEYRYGRCSLGHSEEVSYSSCYFFHLTWRLSLTLTNISHSFNNLVLFVNSCVILLYFLIPFNLTYPT